MARLDVGIDSEIRNGQWIRRYVAEFLRTGEEVRMSDVTFELGHFSLRTLGKKIHDHYQGALSEPAQREAFLGKIQNENDRNRVGNLLSSLRHLSDEDGELIGRVFNATV